MPAARRRVDRGADHDRGAAEHRRDARGAAHERRRRREDDAAAGQPQAAQAAAAPREHVTLPGLLESTAARQRLAPTTLEYEGDAAGRLQGRRAALAGRDGHPCRTHHHRSEQRRPGGLGAARSTLVFDNGVSTGRAAEIRYEDAKRVIGYRAISRRVATATRGRGAAAAAAPAITPVPRRCRRS